MILAQYNPIGFYASLAQTTWNRNKADGGNEELFRVFYPTNRVPAIQLIVNAAITASIQLYDTNDEAVSSLMAMSVESLTGYKQLIFQGSNLSELDNGDYYLKINAITGTESAATEANASLVLSSAAENSGLTFTAKESGSDGNIISVSIINDPPPVAMISTSSSGGVVDEIEITIYIEGGVTTANDVKAIIEDDTTASALVSVSVEGDGTGIVDEGSGDLAGGIDGSEAVYTYDTYYSDVFGWTDDTSELLKISAVSSDIRLGRDYVSSLTGLTIEGYINAEYLGITPEVDEESATRYGATRVLYANLVPTREFNIYGCEYIYRFLLGLRVLEANGTVSITWNGLTYTANDIMVEKTDEHTPELMFQISLKFVDISEVISVVNETN